MEKFKARALMETAYIKAEFQSTIALFNKIDQYQIRPIDYFKSDVKILNRGKIDAPHLGEWSEDMHSEITPVLELSGERVKHLEINTGTLGGVVGIWMSEIASFEYNWEGKMNEVAA